MEGGRRGYSRAMSIAFVTLAAGSRPPSAEELQIAWRKLWPNEDPIEVPAAEGDQLVFPYAGGTGIVGFMPGPIPWSDLEGPAATAWHWPEATEVLQAHGTHLVVGIMNKDLPPVAQSIFATLLVSAVIEAAEAATAVYWGSGTTVCPARRFVESALEMEPQVLPVQLWVEFRFFQSEAGLNLFTTGMAALGLLEIEIRDSTSSAEDLYDTVFMIAQYGANAGPILLDGQTIGATEDERILIRHLPSQWDRPGDVIVLDL
jgi:hypothetical protein